MSRNPRKAVLAAAVLAAGTLLMTACQESDSDAAKTSSPAPAGQASAPAGAAAGAAGAAVPPPAASSTGGNQNSGSAGNSSGKSTTGGSGSNGSAGSGSSGTTGSGSGANGKVEKCKTDDLDITAIDSTITGDADGTVAVTFKNLAWDCTLSGFAGVDLQTNAGTISAQRNGQPADVMTLKTDQSVSFAVNFPLNDTGGSGVRVTGLVVTPPGETKSVTVQWPGGSSLPVTDGSGAPVLVGPIGSAGQGG